MYGFYDHHLRSYLAPEGQSREVIKKQNGMSHLIDTESVRGNRKRELEEEMAAKDRGDKIEGKRVYLTSCVCACTCSLTEHINACARVYCMCVHRKGPKRNWRVCLAGGFLGSPNFRCNYPDIK